MICDCGMCMSNLESWTARNLIKSMENKKCPSEIIFSIVFLEVKSITADYWDRESID